MFAHSRNDRGERHSLLDHLTGTARLTAEFADALHAREVGYYLGLWHDVGKLDPAWQRYLLDAEAGLTKRGQGPDHKAAGTSLAVRRLGPAALAIQGHHGGLQSGADLRAWLTKKLSLSGAQEALRLAPEAIPDLDPAGPLALPAFLEGTGSQGAEARARSAELFVRLAFSALVDADSLDTEAHHSTDRAALRGNAVALSDLLARLEAVQTARPVGGSAPVQAARDEIRQACISAASLPPGLFRLAAPTGGGKTLSAMDFALRHAITHGHQRVIMAVPFISITEQTSQVYRAIFGMGDNGRPIVLEHHSGSMELTAGGEPEEGDFSPAALWSTLAAENWDAPIVVTTTVQLFESLFGRTRTACRKLHRLARAVIILDEVQSLPASLLEPILDALRELCAHYGTTVLLSTATQPAFETLPVLSALPAADILAEPASLFRSLERVQYEWRTETPLSWPEVADLVRDEHQALAILNTKKDALALLDALDDPRALHLSTLLCGAHRRAVLADVRRRLAQDEPCVLVSTQVVEAGVDLDFSLVLRALGPLEGIIQAAGRCNREGRLGLGAEAQGRMIVFAPADGGMPLGAYKLGWQMTQAFLREASLQDKALDPNDPALFRRYSEQILKLTSTDAAGIQKLRLSLNYPEVSRAFRMIDDDTESLAITQYGTGDEREMVRALLDGLRHPSQTTLPPRVALRQLQPYVVTVRRSEAKAYRQRALIEDVHPAGRPEASYGIVEWHGRYDEVRGLVAEGGSPDAFVF